MKYPKFLSWTIPLAERIENTSFSKILDLGCGNGESLHTLNREERLCVGLDIDRVKLREAHKKHSDILLVLADACSLPFKDKCFDTVMSRQFVSHVWQLDASFRETHRVCSQIVYVEDSNLFNPYETFCLVAKYGLRWLWNKSKPNRTKNLSEFAKCEDIHTIFWWKKKMMPPIKVIARRTFINPILNLVWKNFGPDIIFVQQIN